MSPETTVVYNFILCVCVCDPLQGTPISCQELCDAYAVPGPASPTGCSGIVGEKRQSEVSLLPCHDFIKSRSIVIVVSCFIALLNR